MNSGTIAKDGIIAINLEEGNDLIGVNLTSGETILSSSPEMEWESNLQKAFTKSPWAKCGRRRACRRRIRGGRCCRRRRQAADPPARARYRRVTGIRLRKDDYVVGMAIASEETMLLVASENGLGKRTAFSSYRALRRGGLGVKTLNVTDQDRQGCQRRRRD